MKHPFEYAMQHAINIAQYGQWKTAPNPNVGAVLVHDGTIIAEGFHESAGEAHAELNCLNQARKKNIDLSKCTLVVTLEPCNHHGKTPPCTETIINNNIKHVVIGTQDPNILASGGIQHLKKSGVVVEVGILESACKNLISDFIVWQTNNRPYVIVKLASTLDGKIATRTGDSSWISSDVSRQHVHQLRASIGSIGGVILIGGTTFRKDNPKLTSRITMCDPERQPFSVVVTSKIPKQKNMHLFTDRAKETIIYTTPMSASSSYAKKLQKKGVTIYPIDNWKTNKKINLLPILTHIKRTKGSPYVYCEGGGKIAHSLLEQNLVDELHIYFSPKILGDNKGIPMFDGIKLTTDMKDAFKMKLHKTTIYDTDILLILKPERSYVYRNH